MLRNLALSVVCMAVTLAVSTAAMAESGLPRALAWSAYGTGSAGYNQSVAIGGALKNVLGVDLRVLPGKNDVSRQKPLRAGKVHFSATGIGGSFMAQEAVFEFGTRAWGPQPVRLLMASYGGTNIQFAVAGDAGVRTIADLVGKRVAWVLAAPAINENARAILAFAGLGWNDVVKVAFPGFGASMEGIINNQVDAAISLTTSGRAYQIEASPRGIYWPLLPHGDEAGWQRLRARAPYFTPNMAVLGAGISPETPHEGGGYAYPILVAYEAQDTALVHAMTRAMVDLYPRYRGIVPGIDGWALGRQNFAWVVPYHDGAIGYFAEAGVWSQEHQTHNDRLIARQAVLRDAWRAHLQESIEDAESFRAAWMSTRAAALEAAGFEPYYR